MALSRRSPSSREIIFQIELRPKNDSPTVSFGKPNNMLMIFYAIAAPPGNEKFRHSRRPSSTYNGASSDRLYYAYNRFQCLLQNDTLIMYRNLADGSKEITKMNDYRWRREYVKK